MTFTSEQLNYLVWRYLQEHGHALSALAVDKECKITEDAPEVPCGELVRLVLKGLQMSEIEAQISQEPAPTVPRLEAASTLRGARCIAGNAQVLALGGERGAVLDLGGQEVELRADSAVTTMSLGQNLAVGALSGQLRVWDAQGSLLRNLSHHKAPLVHLEYNKSGTHLLSIDAQGNLAVWEGATLVSRAARAAPVFAAWIAARTLAVSNGRNVAVHKLDLSQAHAEFYGHQTPISALRFDSSSQLLATGSDDGMVHIWHGRSQQPIRTLGSAGGGGVVALVWLPAAGARGNVPAAPTEPTSRILVCCNSSIACFDLDKAEPLWSRPVKPPLLFASTQMQRIAVASAECVEVFDSEGELLSEAHLGAPCTGLLWRKLELFATTCAQSAAFRL